MYRDIDQPNDPPEPKPCLPLLKPGEIWEVSRVLQSPIQISHEYHQQRFSEDAQQFLEGTTCRYVMIVKEPELSAGSEDAWRTVSVMLMSNNIRCLSDVDVLVPKSLSGLEQNLLAETWHLSLMLTCNLSRSVGQRLSRQVYDGLLAIGDHYHGFLDTSAEQLGLQQLGLVAAPLGTSQRPDIQAFHQQEIAWSDILRVPVASYYAYLKAMNLTSRVLEAALQLDQELQQKAILSTSVASNRATDVSNPSILSQWFDNLFAADWLTFSEVFNTPPAWATATRNSDHAVNHVDTIQGLVNQVHTAQDDETLWQAVESLWQLDPDNPAAGVRRVKQINWSEQHPGAAVALMVALVQKANQHIGVLLRVAPTDGPQLPLHLTLSLIDGTGNQLREVTAQPADFWIQLKLSGQPGEAFSVRVALVDAEITEYFVL